MASAKKKPSAKHSAKPAKVKYAAKSATASSAQSAQRSNADWIKGSTAEWQKGAQDWANQSAKLYQLPFGQANAEDAAKKAAASVQSATEGMMNLAQQMFNPSKKVGAAAESFDPAAMFKNAQQMFTQSAKAGTSAKAFDPSAMFKNMPKMPNFDPKEAQEKLTKFTREATEQLNKTTANSQKALNEAAKLARENAKVLADVSNIAVTASKELGAELVSNLNKLFTQNMEFSKQVQTCRTLNDLFDLNSRAMKANLDSFFSQSIKLSEKLFHVATEISEPLNECVSETTQRMSKAFSA